VGSCRYAMIPGNGSQGAILVIKNFSPQFTKCLVSGL